MTAGDMPEVDTMLLMWGKDDDGQLGTRHPCGASPTMRDARDRSFGDSKSPRDRHSTSAAVENDPCDGHPHARKGLTVGGTDLSPCIPSPSQTLVGSRVLQVSCGSRHTLAVVDGGEAYSWGWGACGQLGHGDDRLSSGPRVIEALKTDKTGSPIGPVLCVSAGGIHSAVVVEGGFVYTWGGSSYGQLGLGPRVTAQGTQGLPDKVMVSDTESPRGSPRAAEGKALTRRSSMTRAADLAALNSAPKTELLAKVVSCGGMHTAALTDEGVVYCWGRADSGQLGIGTEWIHETSSGVMGMEWPRRVCGLLEGRPTASIACGGFHTAAVMTDGDCYTWGKEDYGMLGCSSDTLLKGGLFSPHLVTLRHPRDEHPSAEERNSAGCKAVAVACGGWHTAVVGEKGGVWTCGRGEYGRLGHGDQKSQWLPTLVPMKGGPQGNTEETPAARDIRLIGGVFHLGNGDAGVRASQSPAPTTPPPPPPVTGEMIAPAKDPATAVALGGTHSLVLTSSGKMYGFGRQEDGRLGADADPEGPEMGTAVPIELPFLQKEGWCIQSISAGGAHSAAILTHQG